MYSMHWTSVRTLSHSSHRTEMSKMNIFPCELSLSQPFLPAEIWEVILNHLQEPIDLLNAINAGGENWGRILSPRVGELFPLVLQVPNFMNHLSLQMLLTCRLINSRTKATIDSTLQHHSSAFPENYFANYGTLVQKKAEQLNDCYTFNGENECIKFLMKMGHYETMAKSLSLKPQRGKSFNPFILGCVQINLMNNFSYSCAQLIAMFKIYGEGVLSLKMRFGRAFSSHVGILLTILECVPNLRHFEVSNEPSLYFFISWPCHFQEIYDWIQECRLPQLVSLNVSKCKTYIGRGEVEYWDDWEGWKNKPKTVEGALYGRFQKQLVIDHAC